MRKKIAAGNWKMNGVEASLSELDALKTAHPSSACDIVICPPAPLLYRASEKTKSSAISIGAQDCHADGDGAHTGDISATMIADAGATHIIVGHSERREAHHESDLDVRGKARAASAAGLSPIICLGETEAERDAANTLDIIAGQLAGSLPDTLSDNTIIAYEPIWAIGTGKVPTLDQIIEVHDFIRAKLAARFSQATADTIPLLYGGSVKPDNAATIFQAENVDGALVGGASLKAADFSPIISALNAS